MLRITIHDQPRVLKIQLEGMLTGQWLQELEACWLTAMARQPEPSLLADLTGVTFTDDAGKACLATMHRQGVQFISDDCMTNAIVDEIAQLMEQVGKKQQDGVEANEDG
jgi:anti-anti-sigma regulatory factor